MTDFTPQRILWSGGLNSSSVILRLEADVKEKVLLYQSSNLELLLDNIEIQQKHVKLSKLTSNSSFNLNAEWVEVSFHSLSPNTYYSLFLVPLLPSSRFFLGKFSTFPTENTPFNFSFSAASCAKWQSSASSTYLDILSKNPFFFISSGDLFYGDISTNDITSFIQQYLSVLQTPTQKSFFSQISTFYIFDDHDFSNNDSNGTTAAKVASLQAYDQFYPHYPFQRTLEGILGYQAFTVGRVRFIMTDLRSQSTGPILPLTSRTTLGLFQRQLLLNELSGFHNYALVVWVSTKPWSGFNYTGTEDWSDYAEERALIANHIATNAVNNLIMIAGDAHMIAADDGTHTDFSTLDMNLNKAAGFPLFHSAPMAQYGSSKGGQYSLGCYGYLYYPNYQYSMFTINDSGNSICLKFDGYKVPSSLLVSHTLCRDPSSNTSTFLKSSQLLSMSSSTCRLLWFPVFVWVLISLGVILIALSILLCILKKKIVIFFKKFKLSRRPVAKEPKIENSENHLVPSSVPTI